MQTQGLLDCPFSLMSSLLGCPCPCMSSKPRVGLNYPPCLVSLALWTYFRGQLWAHCCHESSFSRQSEWVLTSSWDILRWDCGCAVHLCVCCYAPFSLSVVFVGRPGRKLLSCPWEVLCKGLIFDPFCLCFCIPCYVENRVAVCSSTGPWFSVMVLQEEKGNSKYCVVGWKLAWIKCVSLTESDLEKTATHTWTSALGTATVPALRLQI